jgi:hypothetical protein
MAAQMDVMLASHWVQTMVVRMVEWKVVKLVKSWDGKTVGMKVVTLVLRLERLMVVMMAVMSEKM